MTARDPFGHIEPPFTAKPHKYSSEWYMRDEERQQDHARRAWDWPLTPAVLCVLAAAVAFVVVLRVGGLL